MSDKLHCATCPTCGREVEIVSKVNLTSPATKAVIEGPAPL